MGREGGKQRIESRAQVAEKGRAMEGTGEVARVVDLRWSL